MRARLRSYSLPPEPGLNAYFDTCVIGGPGAFTEIAEGPADFTRAVRRKLVREIAGAAPAAAVVPASATPCE